MLDRSGDPVTVQRTFTTPRSTEFDAILPAGAPAPAADACGARDAKVDDDAAVATAIDPRLPLMVTEAYRRGKAIGAWGEGASALEAVGCWRRPIWPPATVLVEDGLRRSGHHRLADEISASFRALCETHRFAESFDSLTGTDLRDRAYHMDGQQLPPAGRGLRAAACRTLTHEGATLPSTPGRPITTGGEAPVGAVPARRR